VPPPQSLRGATEGKLAAFSTEVAKLASRWNSVKPDTGSGSGSGSNTGSGSGSGSGSGLQREGALEILKTIKEHR
jgi:hypothetical protein